MQISAALSLSVGRDSSQAVRWSLPLPLPQMTDRSIACTMMGVCLQLCALSGEAISVPVIVISNMARMSAIQMILVLNLWLITAKASAFELRYVWHRYRKVVHAFLELKMAHLLIKLLVKKRCFLTPLVNYRHDL